MKLTPEQRKAVTVLQENLQHWDALACSNITDRDICETDFKAFSTNKVSYSDLKHGANWTWNQSNAKKKVTIDKEHYAFMQKFNTRKKNKDLPSNGLIFKLWVFSIYKTRDQSFTAMFVWCEKGKPKMSSSTSKAFCDSPSTSPVKYENQPLNCYDATLNFSFAQPELSFDHSECDASHMFPRWNFDELFEDECDCDCMSSQDIVSVTLKDLAFLRPYVNPSTAMMLDW